jgi:hypothetical protein
MAQVVWEVGDVFEYSANKYRTYGMILNRLGEDAILFEQGIEHLKWTPKLDWTPEGARPVKSSDLPEEVRFTLRVVRMVLGMPGTNIF